MSDPLMILKRDGCKLTMEVTFPTERQAIQEYNGFCTARETGLLARLVEECAKIGGGFDRARRTRFKVAMRFLRPNFLER